jgi:hypothetical protein
MSEKQAALTVYQATYNLPRNKICHIHPSDILAARGRAAQRNSKRRKTGGNF